jgi:hypothetical protein
MRNVKEGDVIYVTAMGQARVTRVMPDGAGFHARIGQRDMQFSMDGRIGGKGLRRAFWHDPALVVPCQDGRFWAAFKAVAGTLHEEMARLDRSGALGPPE